MVTFFFFVVNRKDIGKLHRSQEGELFIPTANGAWRWKAAQTITYIGVKSVLTAQFRL